MLKNLSLFLSAVFSPLIIPTYGIAMALSISALNSTPFNVKMSVVLMVAAMTFLLPLIVMWLMLRVGYISGFALEHREERFAWLFRVIWPVGSICIGQVRRRG